MEKWQIRVDFSKNRAYNNKLTESTFVCGVTAKPFREVSLLTERDLRKLNRYQLLELLVVQTERADKLQQKLEAAEHRLNDRDLQLTALGSIAEASLQLSGVFQAAQNAADQYLNQAKKRAAEIEAAAHEKAAAILAEAEVRALAKNFEDHQ